MTCKCVPFNTGVQIGFEEASYTFREGVDMIAEVCFTIISPPLDQIDPLAVFAIVNVEPFEDSAQGTAHFSHAFTQRCLWD